MKCFQKISRRERMRQIDYRARQADRQEERQEERAIQKMIRQAEKEKQAASQPVQENQRQGT